MIINPDRKSAPPFELDSHFERKFKMVKDYYFSRNPRYWPCFSDPGFKAVIDFRQKFLPPDDRMKNYPQGTSLFEQLATEQEIPSGLTIPNGSSIPMLEFAAALSKDWENPASVENVITMPCDPGIYGSMIGLLANPNLVYREYSGMADELEKNVVRQVANLAGYEVDQATGIFTQGGTFCNLYGYLAGIRKSLPEAKQYGMGYIHDYRIINSQGGHYSNITNLSLLGVDIQKRTIRIKIKQNNDIDLDDLEGHLRSCFSLHCVVPTIMLTMGTTDTFAVDRVKPVYELRNRLCRQFEIEIPPHIHVDSAIGWTMLFFLDYDFETNPLRIHAGTLAGIRQIVGRLEELKYADSFTVDFQKWGYVPYTSSLVMFKNKADLKSLESDPDNFYYFESELQGQTHLQSTIECSRGAAGVFGAYAALKYMGREGYQILIAHCLQNANYFRHRLRQLGFIKVLAPENHGPSVSFRIYNPEFVPDVDAEFEYEFRIQNQEEYWRRVERNNSWHRQVFLERGKVGLFTNWVTFIAHTDYDEKGKYLRLPGEKAVFMNPATSRQDIDRFIEQICPLK
jgi:glutamate/tyrosine decarboxylase-like PLP-dependent enzyme